MIYHSELYRILNVLQTITRCICEYILLTDVRKNKNENPQF